MLAIQRAVIAGGGNVKPHPSADRLTLAGRLLPAVLSVAGGWVDRIRVPFTSRDRAVVGQGFWHRWAILVVKRPLTVWGLALLLLLPFVGLGLSVRPTFKPTGDLSPS